MALVAHCGLYVPTEDDVRAAHEAIAYFLSCCNEEMLASEAGPALHDRREQRRADIISARVDAANRKLDDLLLLIGPPDEALSDLIAQSERENPGLSFSAHTTAQGTMFEVSSRVGSGPVHLGTLSFPPTECGRRGHGKFLRLVEEGRLAELQADEARWTPAFSMPGRPELVAGRIVISPSLRSRVVPVRVETPSGVVLVDYAELRLVRAGTKEQELSLSGGRLAGTASFLLRTSGAPEVSFELTAGPTNAADALRTTEFFLNLVTGNRTRVVALETRACLFDFTGHEDRGWTERLLAARALLQDLLLINERLGLDLRYPEVIDEESAFNARVLAEGLRRGRVSHVRTIASTGKIERSALQRIVEQRPDAAIQIAMTEQAHAFALFGRTIEVPCRVVLEDPVRADFDKAAEQSADAGPEDLVEARVTWARITYEFPGWRDASARS